MSFFLKFYLPIIIFLLADCQSIKGKDVLDRAVRERERKKGFEFISYDLDKYDASTSKFSVFYFTAKVKSKGEVIQLKDTITLYKTMDDLLVDPDQ